MTASVKRILYSFLSRFLMLGFGFGLVIFSSHYWGAHGKGEISLVIADLALVGYAVLILAGSSVSFFINKFPEEQVLAWSYAWGISAALILSLLIYWLHGHDYFLEFLAISILQGIFSVNVYYEIGRQNIGLYNIYNAVQPGLQLALGLCFYFFWKQQLHIYFWAQIFSLLFLVFYSTQKIIYRVSWRSWTFPVAVFNKMFQYGWKIQAGQFMQFLANRISYYFIQLYVDVASVGIFSVAIACSEAVFALSRSLAVILYADVVNESAAETAIVKTKSALKVNIAITILFTVCLLVFPNEWYILLFGKSFSQTKFIILLLSPGILAMSVSLILSHYYSAVGNTLMVNVRAASALVLALVGSMIFIPKYGLVGASLVTSAAYTISALILMLHFHKLSNLSYRDLIFSKKEVNRLIQNFKFHQ